MIWFLKQYSIKVGRVGVRAWADGSILDPVTASDIGVKLMLKRIKWS